MPVCEASFWNELNISPETLMRSAVTYRMRAYAPYSKFPVGAALLMEDGTIVGGCNVENASYGLGICAERIAMGCAVASGRMKPLAVAVVGGSSFCSPCGACRQFLAEFNSNMQVVLVEGDALRIFDLHELLPYQFRL